MAEMSENMCIVCLSEVAEPFLLQCCRKPIDNDCFSAWVGTCRNQYNPITCPHCRTQLTETGEIEMDEVNFEGEDFFSLLSEEIMQEETPPPSPTNEFSEQFSEQFMSRVRHIWRERPFWRDDRGEWMGQIRDCIDGYVMTVSLGIHPTTIQENMETYVFYFDRYQMYYGWEHYQ